MAKKPTLGKTKTRLTPELTPNQAVGLYEAMLADTVTMLTLRDDCETIVAVDEPESLDYFARFGLAFVPQGSGALGERLDAVLSTLLDDGFDQAFAINSDGPDLPPEHLTAAFAAMNDDDVDVVLGPTADGGYYLIGWKQRWTRMVAEVEMSTAEVFADTMRIAEELDARVWVAPMWFDVDVAEDIARLRSSLGARASATADYIDAVLGGVVGTS